MFEKLDSINFEQLKAINFSSKKWNKEFKEYFQTTEKIYNLLLTLKEYKDLLTQKDKTKLTQEINNFSTIHLKIQNGEFKKPDGRLKISDFGQTYINWLNARIDLYSHFSRELLKKEEEKEVQIKSINDQRNSEIQEKEKNIEVLEGEKTELLEEIKKHENTIKIQTSDIEEKQKQIKDQELNKLAQSFGKEEEKYKEGSKKMIYIGFGLLVIPSLIIIVLLILDIFGVDLSKGNEIYLLAVPFGVLTIILWYFQYFQLKNYYINKDLETNFANRKAVANSFRGLLEMVNEEQSFQDNPEVKSKFFDKVSSILYSEIDTSYIKKHNDDVPVSKILDTITEVIKKIK